MLDDEYLSRHWSSEASPPLPFSLHSTAPLELLSRHAVCLAALFLVDYRLLLGLELSIDLGAFGGLVAVGLGLLRIC